MSDNNTSPTTDNLPVILVTGSAKRIGAEIIKQAHAQGYNVIIHYHRSQAEALALQESLNQQRKHSAHCVQADLSIVNNSQSLTQFVKQVIDCFGRLDVLVNNASRFYPSNFTTVKTTQLHQQWEELFLTNAKAPLLLSHALLPYLQTSQGCIINILDIHADGKPFKNYSVYNMAKSAGRMMVQSLALQLAPHVRVNGIAPGVNVFPDADTDQALTPDMQHNITASVPLAKAGTPTDIAQAVIYLTQASYVTGQILAVDGGRSLTLAGSD